MSFDLDLLMAPDFNPRDITETSNHDALISQIEGIVLNEDEFKKISENEQARRNLLKLVNQLYLEVLLQRKPAMPTTHAQSNTSSVLSDVALKHLYSLPA